MAAALRAGLLNIFFKSDRAFKVIYFTKNTWGGELHSKLKVDITTSKCSVIILDFLKIPSSARFIHKGTTSFVDSYSCFFDFNKQV